MRGPDFAPEYLQPHVKDLQQWEDKVNEVIMALETNAELLSSLRRFYKSLPGRKDFPNRLKSVCGVDIQTFGDQIEQMKYDFQMQLSHAKLLVKITVDRKELVSPWLYFALILSCPNHETLLRSYRIFKLKLQKEQRD